MVGQQNDTHVTNEAENNQHDSQGQEDNPDTAFREDDEEMWCPQVSSDFVRDLVASVRMPCQFSDAKICPNKKGPHPISSLPCLVCVCIVHTCFVCVSLRVFKGLSVVLRCVCVVCLVRLFGFVSRVLFGDVNVEQQTSPFLPGAMPHRPRPGTM